MWKCLLPNRTRVSSQPILNVISLNSALKHCMQQYSLYGIMAIESISLHNLTISRMDNSVTSIATPTFTQITPLSTEQPNRCGVVNSRFQILANKKSHMGFRVIPTWMTLNGVIALILRLIASLAKYVRVVEYRPIMSVNIVSQFESSTFGHK